MRAPVTPISRTAPLAALCAALLPLVLALAPAPAGAGDLLASTLFGGAGEEAVTDSAVAADGTVYVVGWTESSDLPVTPGAFDATLGGERDAYVAHLSADLTTLLAATYLGGAVGSSDTVGTWDGAEGVVVADDGVWLTGYTYTEDFPVTPGAFDVDNVHGGATAFVAKLSLDLARVETATYLGESDTDLGEELALAPGGDVYVTGLTIGSEFPTTDDAWDTVGGPFEDVFVSRLSADLSTLVASTLVANGAGSEIALAADGDVYVVGDTSSPDFPTTPGAFDRSCGSDGLCDPEAFGVVHPDVFLSRLDADLTTLQASSYLGHDHDDVASALALDADGGVHVSGSSSSSEFPTTPGAYQSDSNGFDAIFASRLDADLTTLQASTLLGGFQPFAPSQGYDMAIDGERVYVVGETFADDFPATPDAFDQQLDGANDAVVSVFDRELTTLTFSTLLGGDAGSFPEEDRPRSLALAADGTLYVAGRTISPNFPTTPGSFQETPAGGFDGFVSWIDPQPGESDLTITLEPVDPPIVVPPEGGSFEYRVEVTNSSDQAREVDFWREIETPAGDTVSFEPRGVTIPAGATVGATLTQNIPSRAPAGTYTFVGTVGDFPVGEASDSFGFEKSAE